MEQQPTKPARRCSACGGCEPDVKFYRSTRNRKCAECLKARSRQNRIDRARKVALADQFAAFLANYQSQTTVAPADKEAS